MLVIDAHLDLSWSALNWNRDLTQEVPLIRQSEAGMEQQGRGANTVSLPAMRQGRVAICLATLLARANPKGKSPLLDYRSQEIASAITQGQLAYYRILEKAGYLRRLDDWRSIEMHFGEWQAANNEPPLGYILSMEGADPILSPKDLQGWWDEGLRALGLAHYGPSAYAHGTASSGGLTRQGVELVKIMDELGMILDATHLAEESFWQALNLFQGPVIASHNNCRELVPGDRQFSDDQIRSLIERDAVIGAAFDNWMLYPGWMAGQTSNSVVSLENVIDHIDHVCQLAGNSGHAAIGSDLDGGFGREQSPGDLDTIADLQKIPALLRKRGYAEADVEAIMHANWLRVFRKAWA
ncbi:MAG: dipeptidase [Acidobacteria bacterium]|nr:dipeptidase [Acidobacteriota bacterium]MCI0718732.1 dipeptidase [Acidobacteriota bacterium]